MSTQNVLIGGRWRPAQASSQFQAFNPATGEPLPDQYPVSMWADCDEALSAAAEAAAALRRTAPSQIATFLRRFAERIEARATQIIELANLETGYPIKPRLADAEMPRTIGQLRQAAAAAEEGSWSLRHDRCPGQHPFAPCALGPVASSDRITFRSPSAAPAAEISPPPSPPATR